MCILSYLPTGVAVPERDLLNGGITNGDGHGWAIASARDGIIMGKSLDICDALDAFIAARAKHIDSPALFHSRWATHGAINTDNVHPFYMGGSTQTVVGHNGILSCTPKKGDPRSDTRVFADELLSTKYRRLDKARAFEAMSKFIGRHNKLVILTVDPRYRKSAYIVNEAAGNWDTATGVWHSNYDYVDSQPRYFSYSTTKTIGWRPSTIGRPVDVANAVAELDCAYCGGFVGKSGLCVDCGTCEECLEYRDECQCWVKYGLSDNDLAPDEGETLHDYS